VSETEVVVFLRPLRRVIAVTQTSCRRVGRALVERRQVDLRLVAAVELDLVGLEPRLRDLGDRP